MVSTLQSAGRKTSFARQFSDDMATGGERRERQPKPIEHLRIPPVAREPGGRPCAADARSDGPLSPLPLSPRVSQRAVGGGQIDGFER